MGFKVSEISDQVRNDLRGAFYEAAFKGNCIDFPRSVTTQVNKSITSEVQFMENVAAIGKNQESIGEMLRFWRQLNRKSQMDLALDVDISSKHLSFVETGKSKPSRHLVLKIAQSRHQDFGLGHPMIGVTRFRPGAGLYELDPLKDRIVMRAKKAIASVLRPAA